MNKLFLPLVYLIIAVTTFSQDHFVYGDAGYFVQVERVNAGHESIIPQKTDGESVLEIERWRLRQSAFLSMNYRYSYFLEISTNIATVLQGTETNTVIPTLQQLCIVITPLDWITMTFGKQNLKWGTARYYNAVDTLEEVVDPFGNHTQRQGISGFKLVFIPNEWLSFSRLGIPEEDIRWSRLACRLDLVVWDIDIGFGASNYPYTDLIAINPEPFPVTEKTDRIALFLDCIRYFDNVGLYAEMQWRYSRRNRYAFKGASEYEINTEDFTDAHVLRITGGFHYQMEGFPYLDFSLEYFYNGEGFDTDEGRDFYSKYRYHKDHYDIRSDPMILPPDFGRFGSFRRHYGYAGIHNVEITDSLKIGCGVYANLETLSFNLNPAISLNVDNLAFVNLSDNLLLKFLDAPGYPSELSFSNSNYTVTLSISTSY